MHPQEAQFFFPLISQCSPRGGVGWDGFFWEFNDPYVFQMVTFFSHYVLYGYLFILSSSWSQQVPMCSQQQHNFCHMFCPKFYSCNLYNEPTREDYNIFIVGSAQSVISFFCDGSIIDAHHAQKQNQELWGSLHLINTKYNCVSIAYTSYRLHP